MTGEFGTAVKGEAVFAAAEVDYTGDIGICAESYPVVIEPGGNIMGVVSFDCVRISIGNNYTI